MTNAIECCYSANTPKRTKSRIQHSDYAPTEQQKPASFVGNSSGEDRQEASDEGDKTVDNAPIQSDLTVDNLGGESFGWRESDIDFVNFLDLQTLDEGVQYFSSDLSPVIRHSTPPSTNEAIQIPEAISSPRISIPMIPTHNVRRLAPRTRTEVGAQRIANLIFHTLKSYPLMMLRHNTLPPFIHPNLIPADSDDDDMEPLTNCLSLVHMISSGVKSSRKLFWKNVRLECERLCEEYLKLNKWGLLAAMQALMIYLLVRLYEGESDDNNYDFLIIATVAVIAKQITCCDAMCNTSSAQCSYGSEISWKDWLFEESRRRISVVFRVVNMLVYFEPGALCNLQKDLVLAPLPAKKKLWEAGDEFVWKTASEKEPDAQAAFALAANGELVKLDEGKVYCTDAVLLYKPLEAKTPSRTAAYWEEWCSGMDGFGGLVMLAASLVGQYCSDS